MDAHLPLAEPCKCTCLRVVESVAWQYAVAELLPVVLVANAIVGIREELVAFAHDFSQIVPVDYELLIDVKQFLAALNLLFCIVRLLALIHAQLVERVLIDGHKPALIDHRSFGCHDVEQFVESGYNCLQSVHREHLDTLLRDARLDTLRCALEVHAPQRIGHIAYNDKRIVGLVVDVDGIGAGSRHRNGIGPVGTEVDGRWGGTEVGPYGAIPAADIERDRLSIGSKRTGIACRSIGKLVVARLCIDDNLRLQCLQIIEIDFWRCFALDFHTYTDWHGFARELAMSHPAVEVWYVLCRQGYPLVVVGENTDVATENLVGAVVGEVGREDELYTRCKRVAVDARLAAFEVEEDIDGAVYERIEERHIDGLGLDGIFVVLHETIFGGVGLLVGSINLAIQTVHRHVVRHIEPCVERPISSRVAGCLAYPESVIINLNTRVARCIAVDVDHVGRYESRSPDGECIGCERCSTDRLGDGLAVELEGDVWIYVVVSIFDRDDAILDEFGDIHIVIAQEDCGLSICMRNHIGMFLVDEFTALHERTLDKL